MGTLISRFTAAAALTVLVAAHGATATITDFRLPPSDSATPVGPEVEGPVAEDIPQSQPQPVEPAPAPTARAPTPSPAPRSTSTPVVQPLPTVREAAPATAPVTVRPPSPAGQVASPPAPDQGSAAAESAAGPTLDAASPPVAQPPAPVATGSAPADEPEESQPAGYLAAIAILALLLAGGGAALWWRRRKGAGTVSSVPLIERPTPQPASPADAMPAPAATPAAELPAREALRITLAPGKLGVTLMNATLSYQLEITNNGSERVTGLTVSADMIAAHASLGREQQLAGPAADLAPQHLVERLAPGETQLVSGEFRVPLSNIVPIRQGAAALLLPLARFRLEADGRQPRTCIFAVGQPGAQPNGALVPFRLDQGPRIYPHLAHRAFA